MRGTNGDPEVMRVSELLCADHTVRIRAVRIFGGKVGAMQCLEIWNVTILGDQSSVTHDHLGSLLWVLVGVAGAPM